MFDRPRAKDKLAPFFDTQCISKKFVHEFVHQRVDLQVKFIVYWGKMMIRPIWRIAQTRLTNENWHQKLSCILFNIRW